MADVDAPSLRPEILAFYTRGEEDGRLRSGGNRLEFLRTQDVLRRLLPQAPAAVLDVGGGSGVHAEWLAADGHRVTLVDPVRLHVEQASAVPGVTALQGDARALPQADASADAVLLLGPLYHLPDRPDRLRALAEARRVVRPGGLVAAATINRFAGLHDQLRKGVWFDPALRPRIAAATGDGLHRRREDGDFTTAYFHEPADVPVEFAEAGLEPAGQYGLEGAAWLMGGVAGWLDVSAERDAVLEALRLTESAPALFGVSGHLLTAGRRPPG